VSSETIGRDGVWNRLPPEVAKAVRSWCIKNDYVGTDGHVSYVYGECAEAALAARATLQPSPANDVYAGRHYYEPLEDHTWPTYGGIQRGPSPVLSQPSQDGNQVGRLIAKFDEWAVVNAVRGTAADIARNAWVACAKTAALLGFKQAPAPDQGRELLEEARNLLALPITQGWVTRKTAWLSTYAKYTEGEREGRDA